ncbi:DUF6932 family protein [Spirosoma sp. KNUC1025]|uniref:DUF6932 family protein n=1 Tax=Spirosoma sp. KNUC1025 TaxID=2894082 RepID=UPI00386A7A54|nr:hypothetical protein LN737_27395 [Spirosoma sp. KNUC1025]
MLELNSRGLIIPDYNVPSTVDELASVFVWNIPTRQRKELFSKYIDYMLEMYDILGDTPFIQWIDGSFTTTNASPNDIDIVTFVNFDVATRLENELAQFKYPLSLSYGMDAYIVRVFPPEHRSFALYVGDRAYWLDKFSKTERNRRGIVYRKGFIELVHANEERATLKGLRFNP